MAGKLDALMKELNKSAKEEILSKGALEFKYEKIPFTSPRINYCTYGGIPVDRISEFYGPEGGGKTTTALDIVANFQSLEKQKQVTSANYVDRAVLYCDCENTLNTEWATKLGVDVDSMYIYQPKSQSAEEIFTFIRDAIKTGEVGLVVIDSLAAMLSEGELDEKKDYSDQFYGGISKSLSRFAKDMSMLGVKYHCTCLAINQEREDMNSTWGGMRTPGGKTWKYMCSLRLRFSQGTYIDSKGKELTKSAESPVGVKIQMSITKTKSNIPNRRTGFYTLNFTDGIDYLADLVETAIKYEIIEVSGSWYNIVDTDTGDIIAEKLHGQPAVRSLLEENEEILQRVEELVDKKIQ